MLSTSSFSERRAARRARFSQHAAHGTCCRRADPFELPEVVAAAEETMRAVWADAKLEPPEVRERILRYDDRPQPDAHSADGDHAIRVWEVLGVTQISPARRRAGTRMTTEVT